MSFSFPPNPSVGDKAENGNVTYTWDGSKWVSTTGPLVQGSTGPIGATGATGPVGDFDGKTPLVSQAVFASEEFIVAGISTTGFGSVTTVPGFESVAIGPRDNYANDFGGTPGVREDSNLMFNHYQGAPQLDGNSARISLNSGQTAQPASLDIAMKSNVSFGVTSSAILNRVAQFTETSVNFFGDVDVAGTVFGDLIGNIDGDVTGNSGTTDRLRVPVNISLSGDVAGTQSFDGSTNITIPTTIQPNSVQLATDTTGAYVQQGNTSGNGLSGSVNAEAGTFTVTSNAVASATPNTLVFRNASGNFNANRIFSALTGNVTGNADTASRWATSRTLTLSGDLGGSVSIDGSSNVTLSATIQPNSVQLATDTTGEYVRRGATSGNGISGSTSGENQIFTVTSNATENNTPNTIVYRNASGNFSAGTITADLAGNASTADLAADATTTQRVTITSDNGNTSNLFLYFGGGGGREVLRSDSTLRYRASTNTLTTTNLSSSGTITANNLTVTGTLTGAVSGNADTASSLNPGANINGVLFTGASNITITANTPQSLTPGSYINGNAFNGGTARTWSINATSGNTGGAIVARNANGDFTSRNVNVSNLFSTGEVRAGNGAANNPSITFGSDQDTGIYNVAANVGGFTAGGGEVARWDATRFGVGLTQNRYLQIGDGNQNNTNLRIYKRDNNVSDHIQFYNGTTRMGEIGVEDTTWLRINQETAKNIYTPRYILAGGGFRAGTTAAPIEVISSAGVHIGDGSGLTNLPSTSLTGTIDRARLPAEIDSDTTGNAATSTLATNVDVANAGTTTYSIALIDQDTGSSRVRRDTDSLTWQAGTNNRLTVDRLRANIEVEGNARASRVLSPKTGTTNQNTLSQVTLQGMYTQWNRVSGTGSSYFINQKGGGGGGWRFVAADTGGDFNTDVPVLLIGEDGRVESQGTNKTFVGDSFTGTAANSTLFGNLGTGSFIRSDANDTVSANTTWGDNNRIRAGSGGDLSIWHNGTNSYIDNLTGSLFLRNTSGTGLIYIRPNSSENSIIARANSSVDLYFDNALRFQTTSAGATVTGTFTATAYSGNGAGLTNINASTVTVTANNGGAVENRILFVDAAGNQDLRIDENAGGVRYLPSDNRLLVGKVEAQHFGNGSGLTSLNATNISSGLLDNARLNTNLGAKNITGNATSSTNSRVDTESTTNANRFIMFADGGGSVQRRAKVDGNLFYNPNTNTLTAGRFNGAVSGSGASITNINATNITSGTISDARLPGTITSSITGTAAAATTVTITARNTDTTARYIPYVTGASGNRSLYSDSGLRYTPSTNTITATLAGRASTAGVADDAIQVRVTPENTNTNRRVAFVNSSNTVGYRNVYSDGNFIYNSSTNRVTAGSFAGNGSLLTNLPREIPAGSRMLFNQASAPTGWTRLSTGLPTNAALRLNRDGGSFITSGGTSTFTSVFASRGVPLPRHNHTAGTTENGGHTHSGRTAGEGGHTHSGRTSGEGGHTHQYQRANGSREFGNRSNDSANDDFRSRNTSSNGNHGHNFGTNNNGNHGHNFGTNNNGAHRHNLTTSSNGTSGAAMNFAVRYTDVIIARKN